MDAYNISRFYSNINISFIIPQMHALFSRFKKEIDLKVYIIKNQFF